MKCLILTGSPHKSGTTAALADAFADGTVQAGHEVVRFDTAKLVVHPCLGCDHCRRNAGLCVHKDEMATLYPDLIDADAVVLVTPLYYFGMTAQLKAVVDRFYAVNGALRTKPKKAYLLAAGADSDDWAMDGLKAHFEVMCRYLHWQCAGDVFAYGAGDRKAIEASDALNRAKVLGSEMA